MTMTMMVRRQQHLTDNDNADNHADDDNPDSGNVDIDADSDDAETMMLR